jgi:methionine-rich copper-binding protein CopC
VAAIGGVLMLGAAAQAHTELLASLPAEEAEVKEVEVVQLHFSEPLIEDERNRIWLIDDRDETIELAAPRLSEDRFVLGADVPSTLSEGEYFVRYRAASYDGDLNEGGYYFDLVGSSGSSGSYILLGIGLISITIVVVLLRPRRKD